MSLIELLMSLEIGLIYGIAAIGIWLTFRMIDFPDLTCDGSFVLGAATSAVLAQAYYNPIFALIIATLAGALAGLCTGILHTKFKLTNLLSGILVAFMLYSVNLKVMHGLPNITLFSSATIFASGHPLLTLMVITIIVWLLCSILLQTNFGLALRSIGQNKRLASNCGVNISNFTLIGLALSNALISLSGALFSQHQGFADVSQGLGTIIIGLAAVMIGEKFLAFRSMFIVIFSCIVGSIIYRLIIALALHSEWLGLETQDLNLITGLMVVAIMGMPRVYRRKSC